MFYCKLKSESIVEKVEFSECATPMVHVTKADGTTCSCGDYAAIFNPQLYVPRYPIPLPLDVFIKLQGGTRFIKLDLKNAYQQLPQSAVCHHQHTSRSYQHKRLSLVLHHLRQWQNMDTILQGLEHAVAIHNGILIWTLCPQSLRQLWLATSAKQVQINTADEISPTEDMVESIKSTMPWKLHSTKSLPWNN